MIKMALIMHQLWLWLLGGAGQQGLGRKGQGRGEAGRTWLRPGNQHHDHSICPGMVANINVDITSIVIMIIVFVLVDNVNIIIIVAVIITVFLLSHLLWRFHQFKSKHSFPFRILRSMIKKSAKHHQIWSGAPAIAKVCPSDRDVSDDGERVETRQEGHAEFD